MTDAVILAGIEEVAREQLGRPGRVEGRLRLMEYLGLDSL